MLGKRRTIFRESGLNFRFDNRWVVRKYDDHNFYRGLSSAGLKAVDFIGFYDAQAVFIEVKNYQQLSSKKAIEILTDPKLFIERMIQKVNDSRRGIRAIHQFYERNWLYRRIYATLLRLPLRSWNRASWVFWAQLYAAVWEEKQLAVIFWLDFADQYEGITLAQQGTAITSIKTELQKKLGQEGIDVQVYSGSGYSKNPEGWAIGIIIQKN